MYDSGYPSAKRASNYEETTYVRKSTQPYQSQDYLERTPDRSSYRLNSNPVVSVLHSAKKNINDAIGNVSDKKQLNQEAIGEVRQVNQQIIGSLTGYSPYKQGSYDNRNRATEQTRSGGVSNYPGNAQLNPRFGASNTYVTSQFDLKPSQEIIGSGVVTSPQNSDLRNRVNEEIRKNNQLLKYVSTLQAQNSSLRASTKIPSSNNPNVASLIEQNKNLRNQLANASSAAPYNIRQELERLRQENNQLRRDTVTLLKTKSQYS